MDNLHNIIVTNLVEGRNDDFIDLRKIRIDEAISFKSGTIQKQKKTIICKLPSGREVYFLKPGKETTRINLNINDMMPGVGIPKRNEFTGFAFEDAWEYLIKISILNQTTFKKVLVLIYRNCYMIDHIILKNQKIRYAPKNEIKDYINLLDFSLKEGFSDKFKTEIYSLWDYLHFIDLLGWNEDVKYHTEGRSTSFDNTNKRKGRVNTILSIISVPLMMNEFLSNIIENVNYIEKINVKLILSTMQKLSKSRGICVLTNKELIRHLNPFLIENNH